MRNIYYRFYISESNSVEFTKVEESVKNLPQLLKNIKGLKLSRVATDFSSDKKSLSILCEAEAAPSTYQKELLALLLSAGFPLAKKIEVETLEQENSSHDHHGHSHGHHGHSHGHDEQCTEEHSHKHDEHCTEHHEHSHGHDEQCTEQHEHSHDHGHSHGHSHGHDHGHSHGHHGHSHGDSHENHWLQAGIGLVSGVALLALSLSGLTLPLVAYAIITGLSTLTTLYLGRSVYKQAWQSLRDKQWDMTSLYTISTLTILIVSTVSIFVPSMPMMVEAAPFVLGFWHLGEAVEHTLIDKLVQKLDVRDSLEPEALLVGTPDRHISVKQIVPNDIIRLKHGDVLPVDGVLLEPTLLYTTAVNGSPTLKEFQKGEKVKAGMRLAAHLASVELRATTSYQNSYLSLIAKHISKANDEKAPIELFANKVLRYFIPGLLALAALSGILIGTFFGPALALQCVISVLVSACPCALSLITPMAVRIGMKKAADEGITFNNGKALQAAADIDTIVFDLNGTLTTGEVEVKSLNISDEKYLKHVALLESKSRHPVGKIILSHLKDHDMMFNHNQLNITNIDQSHHSGIKATIDGEDIIIGNMDMLKHNKISVNKPYDDPANGSIYIVRVQHETRDNKELRKTKVIGQINLLDPIRPDAVKTIEHLKSLGKSIHLCTGADKATAEAYAKQLGISKKNICANTVGVVSHKGEKSKTSYIKELRNEGRKVAMVGDAANDIAAIADSDLGVAVQSKIGDIITQQHAGMVVQKGSLFPIASAFDVGKKTKHNIFQNLFVSLTFNSIVTLVAGGLFVALGFALNPAVGVALMVLESTIVLMNLFRLKQQKVVSLSKEQEVVNQNKQTGTTTHMLRYLGLSPQPSAETGNTMSSPSPSAQLFSPSPKPLAQNNAQENTQAPIFSPS